MHFSTFAFAERQTVGAVEQGSDGNSYEVIGTNTIEFTGPKNKNIKKINANAKVKVPKKVLKAYKKFLPSKGLKGKGQKIS
ncbi:hypothetical protein [Butyrivibrio sp. WCD2001]|uniref:hypothetical protein n=1 Tax=Butyrivibrio sp. WCD2001 TaxID=1280681 RepID=UPI00040D711E|nr:hypothetical protein [Butyrivibrio sp. WCD2001]